MPEQEEGALGGSFYIALVTALFWDRVVGSIYNSGIIFSRRFWRYPKQQENCKPYNKLFAPASAAHACLSWTEGPCFKRAVVQMHLPHIASRTIHTHMHLCSLQISSDINILPFIVSLQTHYLL